MNINCEQLNGGGENGMLEINQTNETEKIDRVSFRLHLMQPNAISSKQLLDYKKKKRIIFAAA